MTSSTRAIPDLIAVSLPCGKDGCCILIHYFIALAVVAPKGVACLKVLGC